MEIIKNENEKTLNFEKIEIREPQAKDMIQAERIAGTCQGFKYIIALISEVCLFDDKKLVMEDLIYLNQSILNDLSEQIMGK